MPLHRTCLLSLVLAIGDIDDGENESFGILQRALTERLRERILRLCSEPNLDCHHFAQSRYEDINDTIKQTAREWVVYGLVHPAGTRSAFIVDSLRSRDCTIPTTSTIDTGCHCSVPIRV
ncbi:hypothetical protein PR003_g28738 [Phytophthora rubi]|uniref:Uncharacterized protein n=1 Tax=Phytophthora rubi TaxID=129364 RepID=A0A6A4BN16_9STRA|nr:hypothetical protein PR002_g27826 [Phytophthora rubi]KAE8969079.1 hypothetical protein PR001_g27605 [Phytophthora rubi]KAE9277627.1 hypothetical protein PR003_g28738 [Phytophthora rubi]